MLVVFPLLHLCITIVGFIQWNNQNLCAVGLERDDHGVEMNRPAHDAAKQVCMLHHQCRTHWMYAILHLQQESVQQAGIDCECSHLAD
jgi:hypothetical protein